VALTLIILLLLVAGIQKQYVIHSYFEIVFYWREAYILWFGLQQENIKKKKKES
jgi:hypothetical protein